MSLDLASLKNESSRLKEGNNVNNDFLKNFVIFPEGNCAVTVRLLGPALPGMFNRNKSPFFQSTRIHKVNDKSIHCLKTLEGDKFVGECPICRYYNWLWQESEKKGPDEAAMLQAQARAIKPVDRYYYNVIVRKETQKDGTVLENVLKILSVGKTLHKMIIGGIVGNEELQEAGYGDVTHPTTGRDFKIIKTMRVSGKESYPNYDTSKYLEPSLLGNPEQIKLWEQSVHDLAALRITKSADELKIELKKHLGLIESDASPSFDPSEYQVSGSTVSGSTVQSEPVIHREAAVDAITSAAPEDEAGDDDFFAKLRNIKA